MSLNKSPEGNNPYPCSTRIPASLVSRERRGTRRRIEKNKELPGKKYEGGKICPMSKRRTALQPNVGRTRLPGQPGTSSKKRTTLEHDVGTEPHGVQWRKDSSGTAAADCRCEGCIGKVSQWCTRTARNHMPQGGKDTAPISESKVDTGQPPPRGTSSKKRTALEPDVGTEPQGRRRRHIRTPPHP